MDERLVHGFHERGYLPHLKYEGASYFVTFRLADSLPREVWANLEEELKAGTEDEAGRQRERRRRVEQLLDRGSGSCCLRDPVLCGLVASALAHFDGQRYTLEAWVVMPNHVHVIVRPFPGWELGGIVKSWKQFTSRRAKVMLDWKQKRFWQPESYDHWVRDEDERGRIVRYIHQNPVKAALCERPEDWPWSSAAKPREEP